MVRGLEREAVIVRAADVLELTKSVIDEKTCEIWISARGRKFNVKSCSSEGIWRKRSEFKEAVTLGCDEIFFVLSSQDKNSLLKLAENIIEQSGKENGLVMLARSKDGKVLMATIDKRDIKRNINLEMANIESSILS